MGNSVYQINKGINKSIEFKGLKAQYIWYLGGCILTLLIVFAALYIIGVNTFVCLGLILIAGTASVIKIYSLSNRYGEHGMMKKLARHNVPHSIKSYSRKTFKSRRHGKTS
ncbi:DUF4133 domain-containing protein [Paracnuella aquatica]|uniref:DUF4133 domain-containing protein n=1 Tax=Paracnuella aquatica TaxID=2268757 RepID=UPI000DF00842|nr:DUF4133 domain-containing protein [Paracnuella aquatica]RPD44045.1 DUF4133 domain-containing protein [Paracnuella aquatica]